MTPLGFLEELIKFAYVEGRKARSEKRDIYANPYDVANPCYYAWKKGWLYESELLQP